MKYLLLTLLLLPAMAQAQEKTIIPVYADNATATMKRLALDLTTDRCSYAPGQEVVFTITGMRPEALRVRVRHNNDILTDEALPAASWTWTAPEEDFQGYLAEFYTTDAASDYIYGTIAIDVSSDWTRFPRYGFVATFGPDKSASRCKNEMAWLNRCHINGVQFQDWHYAHDWPLGGNRDNLLTSYKDIANRTIATRSIRNYIDAQHAHGMKSIFYNLAFGALDGYAERGVKEEWFIFTDRNHTVKDRHDLPDSWKSDIYLTNPGNQEWQQYLAERNDDVYYSFDFDGYQIDQLGYRGTRYDYNGSEVNLPAGYATFIRAMKQRHPDKRLVMNAVSEYGQQEIASTGQIDFFYNEVWGNHDYDSYSWGEGRFSNLKNIITHNREFDPTKQTVFAAYMNYLKDNDYFNTPGIVMTDAVMFALGGSHLELGGDHMLCREYFPYTGMKWHDEIEDWMTHYYDFHTAYENLLRGDWQENEKIGGRCQRPVINKWEPKAGQLTLIAREVEGKTVVHLLNFTSQSEADNDYLLCWHDNLGQRPWPVEYKDLSIQITGVEKASRVWVASPDYNGGAPQSVDFTLSGTTLRLTLPALQFWTMLVIEPEASSIAATSAAKFSEKCYNLLGQPVSDSYRGIVITNGRKIIR